MAPILQYSGIATILADETTGEIVLIPEILNQQQLEAGSIESLRIVVPDDDTATSVIATIHLGSSAVEPYWSDIARNVDNSYMLINPSAGNRAVPGVNVIGTGPVVLKFTAEGAATGNMNILVQYVIRKENVYILQRRDTYKDTPNAGLNQESYALGHH